MSKPHVAIVVKYYPPLTRISGIVSFVSLLARHLAARLEVSIVTYRPRAGGGGAGDRRLRDTPRRRAVPADGRAQGAIPATRRDARGLRRPRPAQSGAVLRRPRRGRRPWRGRRVFFQATNVGGPPSSALGRVLAATRRSCAQAPRSPDASHPASESAAGDVPARGRRRAARGGRRRTGDAFRIGLGVGRARARATRPLRIRTEAAVPRLPRRGGPALAARVVRCHAVAVPHRRLGARRVADGARDHGPWRRRDRFADGRDPAGPARWHRRGHRVGRRRDARPDTDVVRGTGNPGADRRGRAEAAARDWDVRTRVDQLLSLLALD